MSWLPIEMAPKDGVFDLFVRWPKNEAGFKGFRYTDCYRRPDGKWTSKNWDSELRRTVDGPTHFMEIPEAPPEEEDQP